MAISKHDNRIIHSSVDSEWQTPRELFGALDRTFNFVIDAAADSSNALCKAWYGPRSQVYIGRQGVEDALAFTPWHAGPIYLNPPYDKQHPVGPWAKKCWEESARGSIIVGLFPFAPQTDWYRTWVYGHQPQETRGGWEPGWSGHAAMEEWRLPHRVNFTPTEAQIRRAREEYEAGLRKSPKLHGAGVNHVVIVWRPNPGLVGPWQPAVRYWSYR